ncbi:hypothetical protein pb186bvf_017918 [Paramecium bursaria]
MNEQIEKRVSKKQIVEFFFHVDSLNYFFLIKIKQMSSMTIIIIQNNISKTRYVIFFRFNRHSESKINSDRVNKIIAIKMNSSFSIEKIMIIKIII